MTDTSGAVTSSAPRMESKPFNEDWILVLDYRSFMDFLKRDILEESFSTFKNVSEIRILYEDNIL